MTFILMKSTQRCKDGDKQVDTYFAGNVYPIEDQSLVDVIVREGWGEEVEAPQAGASLEDELFADDAFAGAAETQSADTEQGKEENEGDEIVITETVEEIRSMKMKALKALTEKYGIEGIDFNNKSKEEVAASIIATLNLEGN